MSNRFACFRTWPWLLSLSVAAYLITPTALGHGEQLKVGSGGGPVQMSPAQQAAIGLRIARAAMRPMSERLWLNAEVRPVAGRQAEASSRISGQATRVYATLGQSVRAGQPLVRVQARLVGNPPPSVDVLAPMSGAIDEVGVSVGQSVEPSTALFRIRDSAQVNVVARVYEEDLGKLAVGQTAVLRLLAYPGQELAGRVSMLGPALDPLSRTLEVFVGVANPGGLLKPNLFARVGVNLRDGAVVLAVPSAAIIEANGEKAVFVRRQQTFTRVDVNTGVSESGYTEVRGGLVPGDEVVTQGNRQVYTLWLTGGVPLRDEDD